MTKTALIVALLWLGLSAAAQHNANSPLGMNLGGMGDGNREMPFQDVFRQSRSWTSQIKGGAWGTGPALTLDANGWVTSLESADHYVTSVVQQNIPGKYLGHYHVFFEGEGTFNFWQAASFVSQPEPGHIIINVNDQGGLMMDITSTDPQGTGNYLRNIHIVPEPFLSTWQTQTFNPAFLDIWGPIKVYRFMDWLDTNNSPIVSWSQRTTPAKYTQSSHGVAYEHIVDLCNTAEADPWICIPHLADDNYVTQVATLLKNTLDPDLKIYIEYSNEVWNGQFGQAKYAEQMGVNLGFAPANEPWKGKAPYYAYRSCQIFEIFEQVFGNTDRLVRVLAWQNFDVSGAATVMDFQYKPGLKAYQLTDALAIAPYFGSSLGSPDTQAEVQNYPVDYLLDILDHTNQVQTEKMRWQAQNANSRTNNKGNKLSLISYEGGQHLAGNNGAENNTTLTALFLSANRHPRMRDIYFDYYNRWKVAGGELFTVFASMGEYTKWGSWGALESYNEMNTAPKYGATMAFNAINQPPWWTLAPEPEPQTGTQLLDFRCAAITGGITSNRSGTVSGDTKTWSFSTADNMNLFACPGYRQGEFYGGFLIQSDEAADLAKSPSLSTTKFGITLSAGDKMHSKAAGLFLWRKDQFINGFNSSENLSVGKMELNLLNAGTEKNEVRFVVKSNGQYYISDKVALSKGAFVLAGFNNNSEPEKRWKPFDPSADNFEIPYPVAGTQAVNLNDIEEVGFVFKTERASWSHSFEFDAFKVWSAPETELTVSVNLADGQNNPSGSSPVHYTAVFSKPVNDFTTDDVSLNGSAAPQTAVVGQTGPMDGTTWDIAVSGMMFSGEVVVTIPAGVATNAGNPNRASTSLNNALRYNISNPPTVTVNKDSNQPDPDLSGPVFFTVVFSEAVIGFGNTPADVLLSGTAGATTATVTETAPSDGTTYRIEVSGMTADGTVKAEIPAGAAVNALGAANLKSTSDDNDVEYYVSDPPQLIIEQHPNQIDPAFVLPVQFVASFNQPVTGFDASDIVLSGTALPELAQVNEIEPNDGTTYLITVSGMKNDGTVTASVAKGAAKNAENEPCLASVSTDNSVQFYINLAEKGVIVNFKGDTIPGSANERYNYVRPLQALGSDLYIPFGTQSSDRLFNTGVKQCDFYGGAYYTNTATITNGLQNSADAGWAFNRFVTSYTGAGTSPSRPSQITVLAMWRKDQFMNNMDKVPVGFDNDPASSFLRMHIVNASEKAEIRFIIRQGNQYYISEYTAKSNSGLGNVTAALTGFNNSTDAGKGWGLFAPTATDFRIPNPLPAFGPVDFDDIQEVGFVITSARNDYLNAIEFDLFTVGAVVIDTIPPVAVIQPVHGSVYVPVEQDITISFYETVSLSNGSPVSNDNAAALFLLNVDNAGGIAVPFTATVDESGKVFTISPDADLELNQKYYIALKDKVLKDKAGNENALTTATFTTLPALPEPTRVEITSENETIVRGQQNQFDATVYDQYDEEMNQTPDWSINGGGTIDQTGLFSSSADGVWVVTATAGQASSTLTITVTAPKYSLTVTNGTGSGNYKEGETIDISAPETVGNTIFSHWSGDNESLADTLDASTSLVMPAEDITIVPVYEVSDAVNALKNNALVYPNPFVSHIVLRTQTPASRLRLTDISGRTLHISITPTSEGSLLIETGGIPPGLYILEWSENQKSCRLLVLKKQQ